MSFPAPIVADSDMHVMEPPDRWQRYLATESQHAAPVGMTELRRDIRVRVKSQILLRAGPVRPLKERGRSGIGWRTDQEEAYAAAEARGWDVTAQLEAMDREGVDLAVLFPARGLFVLGLDSAESIGPDGLEPEFAAAIARAYNDWLRDFAAGAPGRLFGAAMLAPHHLDAAVAEARRCVTEHGFRAVYPSPGTVNRRPWHDRHWDPLWAECERLGVPVAFHGGGRTLLTPDFSLEIFADRLMMWHTFKVDADEETAHHYLEWFGDANLVFSTDFPHGDSQYPHALESFRKLPLPEQSQRRIVGENWGRLYGIPLPSSRPGGARTSPGRSAS